MFRLLRVEWIQRYRTRSSVFNVLAWTEPNRSAPSLLIRRLMMKYKFSWRSSLWVSINTVKASRNRLKTCNNQQQTPINQRSADVDQLIDRFHFTETGEGWHTLNFLSILKNVDFRSKFVVYFKCNQFIHSFIQIPKLYQIGLGNWISNLNFLLILLLSVNSSNKE